MSSAPPKQNRLVERDQSRLCPTFKDRVDGGLSDRDDFDHLNGEGRRQSTQDLPSRSNRRPPREPNERSVPDYAGFISRLTETTVAAMAPAKGTQKPSR